MSRIDSMAEVHTDEGLRDIFEKLLRLKKQKAQISRDKINKDLATEAIEMGRFLMDDLLQWAFEDYIEARLDEVRTDPVNKRFPMNQFREGYWRLIKPSELRLVLGELFDYPVLPLPYGLNEMIATDFYAANLKKGAAIGIFQDLKGNTEAARRKFYRSQYQAASVTIGMYLMEVEGISQNQAIELVAESFNTDQDEVKHWFGSKNRGVQNYYGSSFKESTKHSVQSRIDRDKKYGWEDGVRYEYRHKLKRCGEHYRNLKGEPTGFGPPETKEEYDAVRGHFETVLSQYDEE